LGSSSTLIEILVAAAIAAVFGYHIWLGWRTRVVRFPMSVLAVQEFEHGQSPGNFWGIMAVDMLGLLLAGSIAVYLAWGALPESRKPVDRIEALNGCYEGEGLPDFMRPPVHWEFRVSGGAIYDRSGKLVSRIGLLASTSTATSLAFSPGILLSTNEHKEMTVYPGPTTRGEAWLSGGRAAIALDNDWGDVVRRTSCG